MRRKTPPPATCGRRDGHVTLCRVTLWLQCGVMLADEISKGQSGCVLLQLLLNALLQQLAVHTSV